MGFLNQMNIFSSAYDVLWRKYDIYDVIVNIFTGNGGNFPPGSFYLQNIAYF